MFRFDPNLLIRLPPIKKGVKGVKLPPPPPPKFVPPALGAAIAFGALFGWELGKKLSGNTGKIVGEEEEQAALNRARRARNAEISANNQRNRNRGNITLPTQSSQYLVRVEGLRQRWTVNGAGFRESKVGEPNTDGFSPQDFIVFGRPEGVRVFDFVSGNRTYFNGAGEVFVSRSDGSTQVYGLNGGGTIYELINVRITLVLKLPENIPVTFPYQTPTQTRPPRPVIPIVIEPYRLDEPDKSRRPVPPPRIPRFIPVPPPEIESGRRWFPDGSYEDWTRLRDPITGNTTEIGVVRRPNPVTLVPPIRVPPPTKKPPIIKPPPPVKPPPVIPPPPPIRPPVKIPVFVPVPVPVPVPVSPPFPQLPSQLREPQLEPVPREIIPPARETQPPTVPERDVKITIPINNPPALEECDPCIQAIEDKLDAQNCDRETTEIRNLLKIEIVEEPTQTRATWNREQIETVYIAGYFVFTRGGFDLAPEIPIRRLRSAHLFPIEATGYKLYPTNGAVLEATVEQIELPIPRAIDPPCLA